MYDQAKKAYAKIDGMLRKEQAKPKKPSTGLLGMKKTKQQESTQEIDPTQRVAKLVQNFRNARMELRNGRRQ